MLFVPLFSVNIAFNHTDSKTNRNQGATFFLKKKITMSFLVWPSWMPPASHFPGQSKIHSGQ